MLLFLHTWGAALIGAVPTGVVAWVTVWAAQRSVPALNPSASS